MALSVKLQQRQTQSLAMTPQLAQSIKLLQLSHSELLDFIKEEVERNPLLEIASANELPDHDQRNGSEKLSDVTDKSEAQSTDTIITGGAATESDILTDNLYDTGTAGAEKQDTDKSPYSIHSANHANSEDFNLLANLGEVPDLARYLEQQIALEFKNTEARIIATYIAHGLDEDGYFRETLSEAAQNNQTSTDMIQWVLDRFQTLEPVGVGARDLAECLTLQLKEKNRFDPAMQVLLENVELLAKRDFSTLQQLCNVSKEDFNEMILEIRALDPRPARGFEPLLAETIVPDIFVSQSENGGWNIELNSETLPKVLVDKEYHHELTNALDDENGKNFVSECMENANWLTRSLDQRAQTILKVTSEIVKKQDRFFMDGKQYLKPLTLKQVADKIEMHESTVSRATANKFLICSQGTFELKFFFSSAIASNDEGEEAISAEAVKYKIQQMVNSEEPEKILSDEQIVTNLQETGVAIARRTVAKYREAMRIPSSIERRRQKSSSL